ESSAFAGTREYTFKHAIVREVTYEGVLLRHRRRYHLQVASWLVERSGERADEYAGLIAEHYERAGETASAAEWYTRAGQRAQAKAWLGVSWVQDRQGDHRASLESAQRAETCARAAEAAGTPARAVLAQALYRKGWALHRLGEAEAALGLGEQALMLCAAPGE